MELIALTRRNCKLFFKDKWMFFTSPHYAGHFTGTLCNLSWQDIQQRLCLRHAERLCSG